MDDENNEAPDLNAERIAIPLRSGERLSEGFEQRLMSEVRASLIAGDDRRGPGAVIRRSWWLAPRALSLSPLASVGIAVVFAALVALSTLALAPSRGAESSVAAGSADTVHVVRFVFLDSTAKRISLVGDFNGWTPDATPLIAHHGTGMWTASVALRPGQHEYAFIVDGKRWAADPFALSSIDEFGTPSSRLAVGSADLTTTN